MSAVPRFILSTDRTVQVNVSRVVSVRFSGMAGEKPLAHLKMEDGEVVTVSQREWNRLAPEHGYEIEEPHSYIPAQPGWILCEPCNDAYTSPSQDGDAIIGWRLPDMAPLTADGLGRGERFVIVSPDGRVYRQADCRWDSWESFIASTKPKPEGSHS